MEQTARNQDACDVATYVPHVVESLAIFIDNRDTWMFSVRLMIIAMARNSKDYFLYSGY